MTRDPDDDAMTWAADTDPTLDVSDHRTDVSTSDSSREVSQVLEEDSAAVDDDTRTNPALLVTYGVLAGIYLLYAIGWYISTGRFVQFDGLDPLGSFMTVVSRILAIVAPVLWFVTSWWTTRNRSASVTVIALVFGVVLLVPWPFLMGAS